MKHVVLLIIKIYQLTISLDHGLLGKILPGIRICIYYPSCSQYCYESIKKYGTIIGAYLCLKRIIRCTPWHKGGYDPVKEIKTNSFMRIISKL